MEKLSRIMTSKENKLRDINGKFKCIKSNLNCSKYSTIFFILLLLFHLRVS